MRRGRRRSAEHVFCETLCPGAPVAVCTCAVVVVTAAATGLRGGGWVQLCEGERPNCFLLRHLLQLGGVGSLPSCPGLQKAHCPSHSARHHRGANGSPWQLRAAHWLSALLRPSGPGPVRRHLPAAAAGSSAQCPGQSCRSQKTSPCCSDCQFSAPPSAKQLQSGDIPLLLR